jgi:hypothetical protein
MEYVAVILPSLVVGLLFWFAMKAIFNADKAERQSEARAQPASGFKIDKNPRVSAFYPQGTKRRFDALPT